MFRIASGRRWIFAAQTIAGSGRLSGTRAGMGCFGLDDVSEIRQLLNDGYVGADIAAEYGVSRGLISHIKTGKR